MTRGRSRGTAAAVIFVVGTCTALVILVLLLIRLVWAIPMSLCFVAMAVRVVLDTRGNKAT